MANYIDSPMSNPPGNANDYSGSGGDAGKPYSADLEAADGGKIPFKGLENLKGDDYKA